MRILFAPDSLRPRAVNDHLREPFTHSHGGLTVRGGNYVELTTEGSLYSKFGITVADTAFATEPLFNVTVKSVPSRVLRHTGHEVCT